VTTLGELDEAMKAARASKTRAYVEIIGEKMDMPPALAYAHGRLKARHNGEQICSRRRAVPMAIIRARTSLDWNGIWHLSEK
jgi:hypothetical protein